MQYTVLVRRQPAGGYRAIAPAAPGCTGKGRTRREALEHLKVAIEAWLLETEITTINIVTPTGQEKAEQNPWLATAGIFANDPTLEAMLDEIYAARAAERLVE
jgi:predicted RNase H-like HicB family nuclease